MRRLLCVSAVLLAVAQAAFAAPPEVPPALTVGAGKVEEIVVKAPAGKEIGYKLVGGKAAFREMKPDNPAERVFWLIPDGSGPLYIVWWTQGETASAVTAVNEGAPPTPTPPTPKPPDPPTPAPEGFRVIWVYETSAPLTPAMQRVMFGEKVRAYLDAKAKGWRRYDKDIDATNERDADIRALWAAAKPQVSAVPCVVVAVGGKAEILPFPADEDAALELLKKYGG